MTKIAKLLKDRLLSVQAIALSSCLMIILLLTNLAIAPVWSDSIHWDYDGAENPANWGKLSDKFRLCELGKTQSPINIKNLSIGSPANIKFDYRPSPLEVTNNGHSIQVNYAKGSTVTIDGEKYMLVQFHFHSPSEHQINDQAAPMELHLVHSRIPQNSEASTSNQLAVLGVMLEQGVANPLITEVWKNIPKIGATQKVSTTLINAMNLLPASQSYFSYDGSLTTPPCSEGVKWKLFTQPLTVSPAQIATFTKLYPNDARPVQPLNERMVELHL